MSCTPCPVARRTSSEPELDLIPMRISGRTAVIGLLLIELVGVFISTSAPVDAQDTLSPSQSPSPTPLTAAPTVLNAPVTALAVRADHLLIGQNGLWVDAAITPDSLTVAQTVDLAHGAIRAIALADNGAAVTITEDGLIALDSHNSPTDYAPGGGYRVALRGERVYVAALGAGVRIYTLRDGKLSLVGHIDTPQPAEDIAPEGANDLWVALGSAGLQLLDLTNPSQPIPVYSSTTWTPAHLVRVNGLHLLVGYGQQAAVLNTINIKAPQVIGSLTMDGSAGAAVGDALFNQNDIVLGRVDISGPDVVYTRLTPSDGTGQQGVIPLTNGNMNGSDGAGDRLARYGDDLFVGSERTGLRRVRITASAGTTGGLSSLANWPLAALGSSCTSADYVPSQPNPANLSAISVAGARHVTLSWRATCLAAHYQVLVNGKIAGTVDQPTFDYTVSVGQNLIAWQVKAQTDSATVDGAPWTVNIEQSGYLESPVPVATPVVADVLYVPPPISIDLSAFQSPGWLLAESCLTLLFGIGVIVAGAWAIGVWSARRRG